jgi:hypothetical protein
MGPVGNSKSQLQSRRPWPRTEQRRVCAYRSSGNSPLLDGPLSAAFRLRMRSIASLARTNPALGTLLPGGYTNEFITGPMVSPYVWGSLATAGIGDASAAQLTGRWYSASSLDYHLRKHLTHSISFGNINGMASHSSLKPPAAISNLQTKPFIFQTVPASAVRGRLPS